MGSLLPSSENRIAPMCGRQGKCWQVLASALWRRDSRLPCESGIVRFPDREQELPSQHLINDCASHSRRGHLQESRKLLRPVPTLPSVRTQHESMCLPRAFAVHQCTVAPTYLPGEPLVVSRAWPLSALRPLSHEEHICTVVLARSPLITPVSTESNQASQARHYLMLDNKKSMHEQRIH